MSCPTGFVMILFNHSCSSYQNNKYRQGVNGLLNENIVIEYGANLDMIDTDISLGFLGCEYDIDFMAVPGT